MTTHVSPACKANKTVINKKYEKKCHEHAANQLDPVALRAHEVAARLAHDGKGIIACFLAHFAHPERTACVIRTEIIKRHAASRPNLSASGAPGDPLVGFEEARTAQIIRAYVAVVNRLTARQALPAYVAQGSARIRRLWAAAQNVERHSVKHVALRAVQFLLLS